MTMHAERLDSDQQLIFVSYAHDNGGWIDALQLDRDPGALKQATFWIDRNRLHPGDVWNEQAKQALLTASAVVMLVSRQFLDSTSIRKYELPLIASRYRAGEISIVFVPIGDLDPSEIGAELGIDTLHNLISIPAWNKPLPAIAERRPDIREAIVSAATEPAEIQNLRRNLHPKYRLIHGLGSGPLGTSYAAHDAQLDRVVTIKLLRKHEHDHHFKESVRGVGRSTNHTNVLTVYGAYLDAVPPHYVRQHAGGDSLRVLLEEHFNGEPLPIPWIQEFLPAIGAAITYTHNKGIDGINIKPSSIIVTAPFDEAAREYFLSLSSYREEGMLHNEAWRTHHKDVFFMPLEYRRNSVVRDRQDAKKADQYRLGLIAYEMLIGAKRFQALAEPLRDIEFEPSDWHWPKVASERSDCVDYISHAVDSMISADPDARYATVDAAISDVRTDLDVELVRDSYRRLLQTEESQTEFFHSFYMNFLAEFPKASRLFKPKSRFGDLSKDGPLSSGWLRQFQVLKEAVLLLAVFKAFDENRVEPNILTRIVEQHAKKRIPAGLYEDFGRVLVNTAIENDRHAPLSASHLHRAWTNVIQPGIDYMRRKTEAIERDNLR